MSVDSALLYETTTAPLKAPAGSTVSFFDLSFNVKTKEGDKKLINDISVKVKAGELLGETVLFPSAPELGPVRSAEPSLFSSAGL